MTDSFSSLDQKFMRRALRLACKGWGRTSPNPMVGAVISQGGSIIAEGYHGFFGGPHAEVMAFRQAGSKANGATLYVTLEPCNQQGKTPPCTQAILKAGIRRVIVAARDPHIQASGGLDFLKERGVECQSGLLQDEAENLNLPFFRSLETRRPFLALKLALSLDGCIAREDGSSRWITSQKARKYVHHLRAGYQAILVGRGTLIQDNPRLDCRWVKAKSPLRIVMDPAGTLNPNLNVFLEGEVLYFSSSPRGDLAPWIEQIVLANVKDYEGCWQVLFEELRSRGGSRLGAFLLESGYLDYLYAFYGPVIFGSSGLRGFPVSQEYKMEMKATRSFTDSFMVEGSILATKS